MKRIINLYKSNLNEVVTATQMRRKLKGGAEDIITHQQQRLLGLSPKSPEQAVRVVNLLRALRTANVTPIGDKVKTAYEPGSDRPVVMKGKKSDPTNISAHEPSVAPAVAALPGATVFKGVEGAAAKAVKSERLGRMAKIKVSRGKSLRQKIKAAERREDELKQLGSYVSPIKPTAPEITPKSSEPSTPPPVSKEHKTEVVGTPSIRGFSSLGPQKRENVGTSAKKPSFFGRMVSKALGFIKP
jgi:hypothetical protein